LASPTRFVGIPEAIDTISEEEKEPIMFVDVGPGVIVLRRMPSAANSPMQPVPICTQSLLTTRAQTAMYYVVARPSDSDCATTQTPRHVLARGQPNATKNEFDACSQAGLRSFTCRICKRRAGVRRPCTDVDNGSSRGAESKENAFAEEHGAG